MFDTWTLISGLVFSSIGFGYYLYGKRQSHLVARYCGIALMVYPYFIYNKFAVIAIGILLMAVPKFFRLD